MKHRNPALDERIAAAQARMDYLRATQAIREPGTLELAIRTFQDLWHVGIAGTKLVLSEIYARIRRQ